MRDFWKGVLSAVAGAGILGLFGYVILIEKMSVKIESIESKLSDISSDLKYSGNSLNGIKLFIASAHPDRDIIPLASATKLKSLSNQEIFILGRSLPERLTEFDPANLQPGSAQSIITNHSLTVEDIESYIQALNVDSVTWDGVEFNNIHQ